MKDRFTPTDIYSLESIELYVKLWNQGFLTLRRSARFAKETISI